MAELKHFAELAAHAILQVLGLCGSCMSPTNTSESLHTYAEREDALMFSPENSKISSLSSFRMTMLFSHKDRLLLEAETISGMNVGQLSVKYISNDPLIKRYVRTRPLLLEYLFVTVPCLSAWTSAECIRPNLHQDQVEFIDVALLALEVALVRRCRDDDLDNKVTNAHALRVRQRFPPRLDQLVHDLSQHFRMSSDTATHVKHLERTCRAMNFVCELVDSLKILGTRCHASGWSWNWVKTV